MACSPLHSAHDTYTGARRQRPHKKKQCTSCPTGWPRRELRLVVGAVEQTGGRHRRSATTRATTLATVATAEVGTHRSHYRSPSHANHQPLAATSWDALYRYMGRVGQLEWGCVCGPSWLLCKMTHTTAVSELCPPQRFAGVLSDQREWIVSAGATCSVRPKTVANLASSSLPSSDPRSLRHQNVCLASASITQTDGRIMDGRWQLCDFRGNRLYERPTAGTTVPLANLTIAKTRSCRWIGGMSVMLSPTVACEGPTPTQRSQCGVPF